MLSPLAKDDPVSVSATSSEGGGVSHLASLPKPPSMKRHLALALDDFATGLADWRIWLLLGVNDIRQRYRRSQLGQFWITLAMATTIVSIGMLYSYLFQAKVDDYLPYLGTSLIVWGLISAIVTDSCTTFIQSEGYVRQAAMPKTLFVHRTIVRSGIVFLHNLIILPLLYVYFGVPVSWALLLAPLGIGLIMLNGVWVGLLVGTVCARFRDLPQIIASLMQVVFFLTPVMWQPSQLPADLRWVILFNPFDAFIEIVRDPLMGIIPPLFDWESAIAVTVVGFTVATLFFARFRARIIYWL